MPYTGVAVGDMCAVWRAYFSQPIDDACVRTSYGGARERFHVTAQAADETASEGMI